MESNSMVELESQTSQLDSSLVTPSHQASTATAPSPQGVWARMSRSAFWKPSSQTIEDAVMGTADGMTVPFALTASLAGIVDNARYVMLAGLAELTAGAISMALGGLLQARVEAETYAATFKSTKQSIRASNAELPAIIDDAFSSYFTPDTLTRMKHDIQTKSLDEQTDFVMIHHHQLSLPDSSRPLKSALTLGSCYFMSGFLGLLPYILVHASDVDTALYISIGVEAVALFVFGYVKTAINVGRREWKKNLVGALSMDVVGAVAAGTAVGLIKAVDGSEHIGF